jgi:CheY-like chemotaxis protein
VVPRREARERPGWRLPIVALTANGNELAMQLCHHAGMDLFLKKPFRNCDVQSLVTLLDESSAAAQQELRSPGRTG